MPIKHVVEFDDEQIRESRETTLTGPEDEFQRHDFDAQTTEHGKPEGKRTAATATYQYSGAMRLKENRSSNQQMRSRVAYVCETSLAAPSQSLLNQQIR